MAGKVSITVWKDAWTGAMQMSIDDDDGGFRLIGPKFSGNSTPLLKYNLTSERDIAEIESYCKRARAAIAKAEQSA